MTPRSAILLALAVLIPAGTLAVLGFVLLGQQREMVRLRQQDRDLLSARIISDTLADRLTRAAAASASALTGTPTHLYPTDDSLLNLGHFTGARYAPPYPALGPSSLESPAFRAWRIRHRQLEAGGASLEQRLRSLDRTPADSVQAAYLAFIRGRSLMEAGREAGARALLEPLSALPAHLVDEAGNPLAFYAAEVLGADHLAVPGTWLGPIAEFYLRDLDSLAWADEYALLRTVTPMAVGIEGWRLIGEDWMVGRHEDRLFALRLARLDHWVPERVVAPASGRDRGLSLSPAFPDLTLLPADASPPASVLWAAALGLMIFLSAMAAVLLFRDQRRERRLAALRSTFVSSVSHEVRTPLSAIRLYTEALLNYGPAMDESEWREDVGTIARETGRLTRMLDNVLTFSRVERGEQRYSLKPARLDRVLEATARVMRPSLEEAGCQLETLLESVEATLDADGIQQAVVNLLANAARYAPGSRVILSCGMRDDRVIIEVTDDGPGLDAGEAARVFEPFYRAGQGAGTGTGLGLSVVEHVALGHQGGASVESSPGQGCRFIISFPASP